jgi:Mg-chelatase subunit ChlD
MLVVALLGCEEKTSVSEKASDVAKTRAAQDTPSGDAKWPPPAPEGHDVHLADNPLAKNYYVVLDGSGSMDNRGCSGNQTKSVVSKEALAEFAQAVPATANLGLLAFDGRGVTERVSLGTDAHNRRDFTAQVNATSATSNTPLRSAITLGYQKLEEQARRQLGYGEYHLVIVTDGEASGGEDPTKVVNKILKRSPVIIHTIGFCIGEDHSLNQHGRILYKAANNPGDLRKGLQNVLAESPTFDIAVFSKQ